MQIEIGFQLVGDLGGGGNKSNFSFFTVPEPDCGLRIQGKHLGTLLADLRSTRPVPPVLA